jgi:prepilin-type N-terminal cleavage/methylation domain-containing protein
MAGKKNHKSHEPLMAVTYTQERGFTLIEIAIAIFLLATSLTIILSLQSSVIARSLDDRTRIQAMLAARRVLAGIESGDVEVEKTSITKPLIEYLGPQARAEDTESLKDLTLELKVEPWTVARFEDLEIDKITLSLFWGPAIEQRVTIFFFVPQDESETDGTETTV